MQYSFSDSARPIDERSERLCRYREIAERLTAQIDAGVFGPDERLPSVRMLSESERVSVTTAVRVFRTLEENGRAYVRERSGYYVRPRATGARWAGLPEPAAPLFEGTLVTVNRHVVAMLTTPLPPGAMPFGSARLDPQLLAQSHLSSIFTAMGRRGAMHEADLGGVPGLHALRCGIARMMGRRGVLCGPDDILITAGGNAALESALRMCARPGDSIAVESPAYFGMLQAIETAGMKAVEIAADPHTGIDLDQLACALATRRIACVMLNPTLHNPLGFTMPEAHRRRLLALVTAAMVPLIEDDPYHDLYTGAAVSPIKRHDQHGMVLYCGSFSKVLGDAYRIGWCLPGRFGQRMTADLLSRSVPASGLAQLVLSEFVRKDYYAAQVIRLRATFAEHQIRMRGLVAQHFPPGTRITHPDGGYIFWVTLPYGVDLDRLYEAALHRGVTIAPGTIFNAAGRANNTFRLCIGRAWSPAVEQALAQLGSLCRHMSMAKLRA